jgi:hypothetical protein
MKSLKKIAVASAAALALLGIQSINASAAPLVVTVAGSANATTSTAPATANVPADNTVDSADAVALTATADTGTAVSFTATGGVKLVTALSATNAVVNSSAGATSYSVTSTGAAVTVYAFTTSTSTGSVTIVNGSYSTVVFIKGIAGSVSNVGVSVPTAVAVGTIPQITVSTSDVFGNPVSDTVTATLIGGVWADGSISKQIVTSTAAQVASDSTLVLGSKKESLAVAVIGTVTIAVTGATSAAAVTGLNVPVKAVVASFTVTDLNGTIAQLQAQINSLSKQLVDANSNIAANKIASDAAVAAKVIADAAILKEKADYNKLATAWNKAFPKKKIALKK